MSQTLNGRAPINFQAKTAAYTVKTTENGTGFTNTGTVAVVTLTLPPATPGLNYYFYVDDADGLRIDPDGVEQVCLPSSGVPGAAGKYLTCATIGAMVRLVCAKAGVWACAGFTGVWTAEP